MVNQELTDKLFSVYGIWPLGTSNFHPIRLFRDGRVLELCHGKIYSYLLGKANFLV